MAPEPRDIIWANAHVNLGWSKGREFTANMLLGLGAILWSVPVASIQVRFAIRYSCTLIGDQDCVLEVYSVNLIHYIRHWQLQIK